MKGFTMKTKREKIGFTIVELLTVMAVIAMLLGILVPSLNLVRRLAKDTNQKGQFHGIEVGLESYSTENNGSYPESQMLPKSPPAPLAVNQMTVGAQRLAEALVGRDLLGFDPNTTWDAYADRDQAGNRYAYASTKAPKNSTAQQVADSLDRREGPYLNVEKTAAFQVGELFETQSYVYDGITYLSSPAPVLTDTYLVKKVVRNNKTVMAGTPILYYKANVNSRFFPDTSTKATISDVNAPGYIYNSIDNEELIWSGMLKDKNLLHYFDNYHGVVPDGVHGGRWFFYDTITNKQIVSQPRPYNAGSYIIMSAGYDGKFGTRDDIYNFE